MMSYQKNIDQINHNKICHDAIAHEYSRLHLDIFNDIEQNRLRRSLDELKKHIDTDSLVLDFGCGSGNLTNHLLNSGYKVVSADVSSKFLDIVKIKYNDNPRHSTYQLTGDSKLDLNGLQFGAICMYSVLHHVPDYLMCLQDLAYHVMPGGLLYIDHEASPVFWSNQSLYTDLQKKSRLKKFRLNYKKLFTFNWYLSRLKRLQNPKYQEEGDIHVWSDDHIEWSLIDDKLKCLGFAKIYNNDYLVYKNHYGHDSYELYQSKVSDMRLAIYKKICN